MASLLLNVWLLGAIFWQSQYLGRQGHLVRQGWPEGARQRAGQHDALRFSTLLNDRSNSRAGLLPRWHPIITNTSVAMDGADHASTIPAIPDCRKKQDTFCSLHGVNYTCVLFPGSHQSERDDRAPSPHCLKGEHSWGVCRDGKFLCKAAWLPDCSDQSTLMPATCQAYSDNVSPSVCVLGSGSVQVSKRDRATLEACLNGQYHLDICMNGNILCSESTPLMLPDLLEQDPAHNTEQEYQSFIRQEAQNMAMAETPLARSSRPDTQPKGMTSHQNNTEPTIMYVVSLQGTHGASSANSKRLDQFRSHWQATCGELVSFKHCPGILNADAHGWKNRHATLRTKAMGYGITQAFIQCFEFAMQDNQSMSVFFEDDARLESQEFCSPRFRDALWRAAPSNSLLLLLGGNNFKFGSKFPMTGNSPGTSPEQVGQFFWSTYSFGAYAFAVPRSNLRALQHWFVRDIVEGQRGMRIQLSPDISWYDLARTTKKRIYATDPLIFRHSKGYSNTWGVEAAEDTPAGALGPLITKQMTEAQEERNGSTSDHLPALASCFWSEESTSCSLNYVNYTCELIPGCPQIRRNDPAPSKGCLPGPYSWGVCSGGRFLCTTVPRDYSQWNKFAARHGCEVESTKIIYCF